MNHNRLAQRAKAARRTRALLAAARRAQVQPEPACVIDLGKWTQAQVDLLLSDIEAPAGLASYDWPREVVGE